MPTNSSVEDHVDTFQDFFQTPAERFAWTGRSRTSYSTPRDLEHLRSLAKRASGSPGHRMSLTRSRENAMLYVADAMENQVISS